MSSLSPRKNVLIVELNEFNVELLQNAIKQYSFPSLSKILSFPRSQYKTPDRYNTGFLEPWVQWVSIHAGQPSSKHHIKHLGDVPDLHFEQCWETLSHYGITSGVWGVMNGARRQAKEALFFLPDPWTFSEPGFPLALNHLLDLPRYVSKNYQNLSKMKLLKHTMKLLQFILSSQSRNAILVETCRLLKNLVKANRRHYLYISYFDYLSTLLFTEYKRKYNPQCSILFLNSLAHLQHHHWRKGQDQVTPEIFYGLNYIDKIFKTLLNAFPEDAIVVHNGLSQMNTNHETPWVLYRQKNPSSFLKALNINALKVEQHMTHDAHVFFANVNDCENAYLKLKNAKLKSKPLFHVERNAYDNCKLFYQLQYTDRLSKKETISFEYDGKLYPFFKYFDAIVTRTGRHIPIGTIFSNIISFPDHINNHDFNTYLFYYLNPFLFPLNGKKIKNEISVSLEAAL